MEDSQMDEDDTLDQSEAMPPESTGGGGKPVKKPWEEDDDSVDVTKGLIGIDQAVLRSIDKCGAYLYLFLHPCSSLFLCEMQFARIKCSSV